MADAAPAGVATVGGPTYGCEPDCTFDEYSMKVCTTSATRIDLGPSNGEEFVIFEWNPGGEGVSGTKQLDIIFRDDQSTSKHKVEFRASANEIAFSDGLTGSAVAFPFAPVTYKIEILHGANPTRVVQVWVNGSSTPVASGTWPVGETTTWTMLEARDDGSCQRFESVEGNDYRWDCNVASCLMTDTYETVHLCSAAGAYMASAQSAADGTFRLTWDPLADVSAINELRMSTRYNATSGQRHTVIFDAWRNQVRFADGLTGLPAGVTFGNSEYDLSIDRSTSGVLIVKVDGTTVATATHSLAETATTFAVHAIRNTGCHSLSGISYTVDT